MFSVFFYNFHSEFHPVENEQVLLEFILAKWKHFEVIWILVKIKIEKSPVWTTLSITFEKCVHSEKWHQGK